MAKSRNLFLIWLEIPVLPESCYNLMSLPDPKLPQGTSLISISHLCRMSSKNLTLPCGLWPFKNSKPDHKIRWRRWGYVQQRLDTMGQYFGGMHLQCSTSVIGSTHVATPSETIYKRRLQYIFWISDPLLHCLHFKLIYRTKFMQPHLQCLLISQLLQSSNWSTVL